MSYSGVAIEARILPTLQKEKRVCVCKGKVAIVLWMKLRRGANLPFPGHWARMWIYHWSTESVTHGQYDARPVADPEIVGGGGCGRSCAPSPEIFSILENGQFRCTVGSGGGMYPPSHPGSATAPDLLLLSQPMAGTNLYCFVNGGTLCVNNLPRVVAQSGRDSNLQPLGCKSNVLTTLCMCAWC